MKRTTVAIVVPNYNYSRYIEGTMRSVFAQTFTDWSMAIVDDCSTDDSLAVARRVACERQDKAIVVESLPEHTGNPGIARNIAAKLTDSTWIVPLDSDDMLEPDYLERTLAEAAAHPDADWVYTDIHYFDGTDFINRVAELDVELLKTRNHLNGTSLISRAMWEALGGHRDTVPFSSDWDFWLRAVYAGYRPAHLREPLFLYRKGHKDSMMAMGGRAAIENAGRQIRENNPEIFHE